MNKGFSLLQCFIVLAVMLFSSACLFTQQIHITRENNATFVTAYHNSSIFSRTPVTSEYLKPAYSEFKQNDNVTSYNWVLKFTASNRVFKDISFANPQVGYIVTELGSVYKTTNGGDNWTLKLNLNFPYYWYGVYALSTDTVVISGFNNQASINSGVVRWTYDGGNSWTPDITLHILTGVGWLSNVHFFNQNTGFTVASFSGGIHYTTTGGRDSSDWDYIQVNQDMGWFAGNIDAQSSGNVYITGIHLAKSTNYGLNWTSGPSADNVFDGGIDFLDYNNLYGWTGGGQISSPVLGWTHRTTDGGLNWGARLTTFPYPIRAVRFFNENLGLAVGGNLYQEAGGIYSTTNGGLNWNLDVNTSAEMFAVESKSVSADSLDIWCVGSTGGSGGYTGKLYKTRAQIVTGIASTGGEVPSAFTLKQNYPNPFNPATTIQFSIPESEQVKLSVYDVTGKGINVLINEYLNAGEYSFKWNASNFSSGVYFYKLKAGSFIGIKKMILIK